MTVVDEPTGMAAFPVSGPVQIVNLRTLAGESVNLVVHEGMIISNTPEPVTTGVSMVIDGQGGLALRPPSDAHLHLDKAGTASSFPAAAGSLMEAIAAMKQVKQTERGQVAAVAARMETTARRLATNGTTAIRAVVDIDDTWGVTAFHAALLVRERLQHMLTIQIVAFPQDGLTPTTLEHLTSALSEGADVLGAHTDIDPDAALHLRTISELASGFGVPIEVHVDEGARPDAFFLPTVLDVLGHREDVTVVHCLSLGTLPEADRARWADEIKAAGFGVCVAPGVMALGVPLTPAAELAERGIPITFGSDNLHDVFCPLGTGRPLDNARVAAITTRLVSPELYRCAVAGATDTAWSLVTGESGELTAGTSANFDVYRSNTALDLLQGSDERVAVVRQGHVSLEKRFRS